MNTTLKGDLNWSKLEKKMKRQRNTAQIKEQGRNSQDQINKEQIRKITKKGEKKRKKILK